MRFPEPIAMCPSPDPKRLPLLTNLKSRGFTLVELLVVIAVVAILAALLLPAISQMAARGKSLKCLSNLRQIGTAFHLYANDNNGAFPLMNAGSGDTSTWMIRLAPYVGVSDGVLGPTPLARAVPPFVCPEWTMSPPRNTTRAVSYAVNGNIRSPSLSWNYQRINVPQSSTFLVVEIAANTDIFTPSMDDVSRRHPNKSANFLYVDGHVENLKEPVLSTDSRWLLQ